MRSERDWKREEGISNRNKKSNRERRYDREWYMVGAHKVMWGERERENREGVKITKNH